MKTYGYILKENEMLNKSKYSSISINIDTELMYRVKAFAQRNNMIEHDVLKECVTLYMNTFDKENK